MEEEENESVGAGFDNLSIRAAGTEEEAEEGLGAMLGIEIEKNREGEGEGEEGGDRNQRELVSLEFLTQEADPGGTMLVDAHNGFDELSRLTMLWNVRHL